MEPGDTLVIYSDGLTEAEGPDGKFFDTERLRECLRQNAHNSGRRCLASRRFSRGSSCLSKAAHASDDITAVVLEYAPGV